MCKKISPLIVFFLIPAFIGLPLTFVLKYSPDITRYAILVYLFFFFALYFYYLRHRNVLDALSLQQEELQEKNNLIERETSRLTELKFSLEKKIKNYQHLEKFTEDLNNEISLDSICDIVVNESFALFGSEGNALLYLVNEKSRRLELRAIKKEDESLKFKDKMGDLFDQWALRHNQPLLVEVASSDFRFDPDKVREGLSRPVGSLICVPLVTEISTLGILRIDSTLMEAYYADDLRFLSVIADISKLAIENAVYFNHTQQLSITDGLTGLFLRRYALERLREEFLRARREASPLSFLMLDIDLFKSFNDRFGHLGGDVVLKRLGSWLKGFFDFPGSLVFRYGGEEFGILLPSVQKKEAVKLAESFIGSLKEREIVLRREKVKFTVSVGVAAYPEDAEVYEDLIHRSDDALLKAKRAGRDRVCSL